MAFLVAMVPSWPAPASFREPVTFEADVLPLLQKHCQSCHMPGEIGPMPLLAYQQVRPWAKAIRESVLQKKMPPWFADSQHGQFSNDRSLTQAEIDTFVAWVDSGAKQGEPQQGLQPRRFQPGWRMGKPDVVFELAKEFDVPPTGKVEYMWMLVPTGFTEDKWVQGIEVRVGNPAVVHHAVIYSREPGSTYAKDYPGGEFFEYIGEVIRTPRRKDRTMITSLDEPDHLQVWAPGTDPIVFAPGRARLIKAGSDIVFQMHYTTNGKAGSDRTRVGLIFAKEAAKERVKSVGLTNKAKIQIPPGEAQYPVQSRVEVIRPVTVVSIMPHMHLRGSAFEMIAEYPNGQSEVLLRVPRYRFHWQTQYQLKKPKSLPVGTIITCNAVFDNSRNNPDNPDPSVPVKQGLQSWEEMMAALVEVSFDPSTQELDFFRDAPLQATMLTRSNSSVD
jgi:hypothetical protein